MLFNPPWCKYIFELLQLHNKVSVSHLLPTILIFRDVKLLLLFLFYISITTWLLCLQRTLYYIIITELCCLYESALNLRLKQMCVFVCICIQTVLKFITFKHTWIHINSLFTCFRLCSLFAPFTFRKRFKIWLTRFHKVPHLHPDRPNWPVVPQWRSKVKVRSSLWRCFCSSFTWQLVSFTTYSSVSFTCFTFLDDLFVHFFHTARGNKAHWVFSKLLIAFPVFIRAAWFISLVYCCFVL